MNNVRVNDVVQETGRRNAEPAKLPYEKPRIKAVALFADQVLVNCAKSVDPVCVADPPGGNGGPIADS